MRRLAVTDVGQVEARAWPGLVAGLVARASPALIGARTTGGAIALGRFQRGEAVLTDLALEKRPVRRVTGGRALALGEGLVALALALPHRSWLVSEEPEALPLDSLLNRAVRGLLSGLGLLGVGASYFGRDFLTVDGAQAGYLSFEVDRRGVTLVECLLAADAHWWLPEELSSRPPAPLPRGVPGPGMIARLAGRTSAQVVEAVARGYAERFQLQLEGAGGPILPAAPPKVESLALPRASGLVAIPAGSMEARVALEDGRILAARLEGDFLADSVGLERVERDLADARPVLEEILPRLDAIYRDPAHALQGAADLETIARAFVAAAA